VITTTSSGTRVGSSFDPRGSGRAVKIDVPVGRRHIARNRIRH
jgi:hypothetical protein